MTAEEYWQHRNIEREAAARKLSEQTIEKELSRLYRRSLRAIQKEIDALYGRFSAQNGVSISEARKLIASDEFQDWRIDISDYVSEIERTGDSKLLLELNTLAMRSRINRLDELHSVVLREVDKLARKQSTTMDIFLGSQYKEGFLQSAFDIRKYIPNVPVHLSNDDVKAALHTPWSGKNYSERIWGNADKLASVLKQEVVNGLHRGTDVRTMARNVAKRMDVSYKNAIRLVRTEHNYIQNKAHIDSIKDAGMKYFKFVATLDKKTSTQCREHDGKIYPVDEAEQGLNAPPLHPHCRSVIVGSRKSYNYRKGKRIAKDANGGTIYVPNDMVYADWKAVYIDKTKTLDEWKAELKSIGELHQAKKKNRKITITDIAIDKVPYVAIPGLIREENSMLQNTHKELLRIAKHKNNSNEVAVILNLVASRKVVIMGDESSVKAGASPEATGLFFSSKERELMYLHNHPKGSSFSLNDIVTFLSDDRIRLLSVVTNQGAVYVLHKREGYNYKKAYSLIREIMLKYKQSSEYSYVIKAFLRQCKKVGIDYVKSNRIPRHLR
ncbi:minor capsid protein [uncultured Veillonella sp.]|uniref:minor capsid protein n=1 Tax=uncultured Veillonella sp. TaxID=159268 RepID=UPI0028058F18|nr:minor capsid protein [uncultured Veillonella sp.]